MENHQLCFYLPCILCIAQFQKIREVHVGLICKVLVLYFDQLEKLSDTNAPMIRELQNKLPYSKRKEIIFVKYLTLIKPITKSSGGNNSTNKRKIATAQYSTNNYYMSIYNPRIKLNDILHETVKTKSNLLGQCI